MTQNTFLRYEKKYILSNEKYISLIEKLKEYMEMDSYGEHTICNIYYDTSTYFLIRNSLQKPTYKEKLRIRSYGIPTESDNAFLEIKKKYNGIVNKRRIQSSLKEIYDYLEFGVLPNTNNTQILSEIDYFKSIYILSPKVYLAYDRTAFFGKEDNTFRVTFDKNIRSRFDNLKLEYGDYGKSLLSENTYLMEVKINGTMPYWFVKILSSLEIYPTSFSKYGNVYINKLKENQNVGLLLQ